MSRPKRRKRRVPSGNISFCEPSRAEQIAAILKEKPVNVEALKEFAPGGYVNNNIRTQVWPCLLGHSQSFDPNFKVAEKVTSHAYWDQVRKDVPRSMHHYDVTKRYKDSQREVQRRKLQHIIDAVLSNNPDLHYIQGYHDVCSVFLLVCGERRAFHLVQTLSKSALRDCLRDRLDAVVEVMNLLFPLLRLCDREVHAFLQNVGMQPMFALSWLLTWFSHDLYHLEDVARLFDFFLASHPLMPLYLSAAVVVQRRSKLLKLEADLGTVHMFFRNMPKKLKVHLLIERAQSLFQAHSPAVLFGVQAPNLPSDSAFLIGTSLYKVAQVQEKGVEAMPASQSVLSLPHQAYMWWTAGKVERRRGPLPWLQLGLLLLLLEMALRQVTGRGLASLLLKLR